MRLFGAGPSTKLPLVGRDDELAVLSSLFGKITRQVNSPLEVCLVHGDAGSGKTSIIRHVAEEQQRQLANLPSTITLHFISGKFDQYQDISSPYSEIVNAFEQLLASDSFSSEHSGSSIKENIALKKRIKACITTEARILTRIIPSFRRVVETLDEETFSTSKNINDNGKLSLGEATVAIAESAYESTNAKCSTIATTTTGDLQRGEGDNGMLTLASERLAVAFRVFLRDFCSPAYPLVLFMDDLQWADENSCRLLGHIANDPSIRNFMLLGCYRDEGQDSVLRFLGLDPTKQHVTDLPVGPLNVEQVDSLVGTVIALERRSSAQTQWDDDDCNSEVTASDLGMLVHRRTQGNPYFVVQFLEMLHSRELLTYDYSTHKWIFGLAQIEASTSISDNVVDVVKARIGHLPRRVQRILTVASFLGFMLETNLLNDLVEELGTMDRFFDESTDSISEASSEGTESSLSTTDALKISQEEGLMEVTNHLHGSICRFSHDRIQECFYDLISEGFEQDRLHFHIGMIVLRRYIDLNESNPAYLFLAVDQLNRGSGFVKRDDDRMFLIEINYKASIAARSKVGVDTVSMFIEKALEYFSTLSDTTAYWDEKYNLFIDLYSLAAEVEFCRGNFERNEAHVEVVLSYAKRQEDAIRVLVCRALAHGVRREFMQAINESKKLLKVLGVKMPRSYTVNFLTELVKAKRAVSKKTDEDMLGLKPMEDEKIKIAMKILHQGSIFGWNSDTTFAGLCYLRMVRLTVQYGWCEATPYALAGYGFMLASLGEETEAFRYSQLAIRSSKSTRALPDVQMMVGAFLSHFERPAALSLSPLIDGYRSGLESGNMMCGTICMSVYAHVYLFSGLSLTSFAKDMLQFSQQLKLCHQELALAFVLPALQLALNLSGQTNDPKDVSINSMRQLDGYNDSMFVDTTVEDPSVLFVYYLQAFSAYLLGDLDEASRALDRVYARKKTRLGGTQILNIFFLVIDGLISMALRRYRLTRKHHGLARSSIKALEALTKKRSVNCRPVLSLLQAEAGSFRDGNTEMVKKRYSSAIQLLTRSGFLHFAAIANELAGRAMLRIQDDYWAEYYLMEAADKYTEWGAKVKVDQMKQEYPSINFDNRKHRESTAMHSRQWFDANVDTVDARQSWVSTRASMNSGPIVDAAVVEEGSGLLSLVSGSFVSSNQT